jgi:putative copper export protein
MVGVTFWVGGIFVNFLVLMPSLQAISPAERGKMMGAFLKRFAPMAWGAIAFVGVTGLLQVNGVIGFPTLFSFNTDYGNTLLVKIVLVLLMVLNGAYIGVVLGPKIASFGPPPGGPPPGGAGEGSPPGPPPELTKLQKRMATMNWVQVVLALVVLLVVGML